MISDSELLMLCHEQNEDAFKMLVNRYIPVIKVITNKYQRSLKYLGITEDEIYNEGIKAIIKAVDYYNEESGFLFKTYVNKVVDNSIKYLLKKYNNASNNILNDAIFLYHSYYENGVLLEEYVKDLKSNPEDIIMDSEDLLEALDKYKEVLTKRECSIIDMLKDGYTCKDVANELQTSLKNVHNAVYRIRDKIKEIINKKY